VGHAMAEMERPINLSAVLEPGAKLIDFRVNLDPFTISLSNSSALGEGAGQHLIIVRQGNALIEFEAAQRIKLIEAAVASFFTPECPVLCFGENHGTARNAKSPHPHLHVLRSLSAEMNLPPQWREPPTKENVPQIEPQQTASIREALEFIREQYWRAQQLIQRQHALLPQGEAGSPEGQEGSRIVQQLERVSGDQLVVKTFAYAGLKDDKSLARLVEKKPA
jgi:hypothetical protein